MKRILISAVATVVFLCLFLATLHPFSEEGNDKTKESTGQKKLISAKDAAQLIEENRNNPDFIILDVRTPEEYSDGHIENALNLDVKSESFTEQAVKLDKGKTYLLHCRSGSRSEMAVKIMEKSGFTDIYEIGGGFEEWKNEGLPVAK